MGVNAQLSSISDVFYQGAFTTYILCLLVSLYYYGLISEILRKQNQAKTTTEQAAVSRNSTGTITKAKNRVSTQSRKAHRSSSIVRFLLFLGLVLHAASWTIRGIAVSRFPLGNLYEYSVAFALVAMIICAILVARERRNITLVPWFLTPTLLLMFYAAARLYAEAAPVVPALQSNWIPIHVTTVIFGASIGLTSGVGSLLYLLRVWEEKSNLKFLSFLVRPLPSADKLDALAYRSAIAALPTFGLGVKFGAIWAESAWGRFWGWDPKEAVSFMTWVLYAAYLHARATPSWGPEKAAFVNLLAFATMIFNLFFINMVVSGLHSYAGLNKTRRFIRSAAARRCCPARAGFRGESAGARRRRRWDSRCWQRRHR